MKSFRCFPIVSHKKSVFSSCVCSFLALTLSGCLTTDPLAVGMLTGSMDATLDLMAGNGNVVRTPDGKTKFTFVIHESATAYHEKTDLKGQEEYRLDRLGSWLGKVQECTSGYDVKKLERKVPDFHMYEGLCK